MKGAKGSTGSMKGRKRGAGGGAPSERVLSSVPIAKGMVLETVAIGGENGVDAKKFLETGKINRQDLMQAADGTRFLVDRANGFVISGVTAKFRPISIDLRNESARLIGQARLLVQDSF